MRHSQPGSALIAGSFSFFGDKKNSQFRFAGLSTITVHSQNIAAVRRAMTDIIDLGKKGFVSTIEYYLSD